MTKSQRKSLATFLLLCLHSTRCTVVASTLSKDENSLSFSDTPSSAYIDNNDYWDSSSPNILMGYGNDYTNITTLPNLVSRVTTSNNSDSPYFCSVPKGASLSPWVSCTKGRLTYIPVTTNADAIPDFSWAGYQGGGIPIPDVNVSITLSPQSNATDDSAAIQSALDSIGKLPLVNGFRGLLLLSPGTFKITKTLYIKNSGVVLKGSGNTTILNVIAPPSNFDMSAVIIVADDSGQPILLESSSIVDTYVPVNSYQVTVDNGTLFNVGDTVLVRKPVTKAWINFMGMNDLIRDGKYQLGWGRGNVISNTDRNIVDIKGNKITLDVPLTDALNSTFGTCTVQKYIWPTRISNVGIENLRVQAPFMPGTITDPQYIFTIYNNLTDAWLRNIDTLDINNGIAILMKGTRRVTVQNLNIKHTGPLNISNGLPPDIQSIGTQVLFEDIQDTGSNVFYAVTESWTNGPNVFRNIRTKAFANQGSGVSYIAPHQRWATGVLFENITMVGGEIVIVNRGNKGSGQGWSAGYSIVWNSQATKFTIQNPPGSFNLCVGCTGQVVNVKPNGDYENKNQRVWPDSLYYEQLGMRLNKQLTPTAFMGTSSGVRFGGNSFILYLLPFLILFL